MARARLRKRVDLRRRPWPCGSSPSPIDRQLTYQSIPRDALGVPVVAHPASSQEPVHAQVVAKKVTRTHIQRGGLLHHAFEFLGGRLAAESQRIERLSDVALPLGQVVGRQ